MKTYNSLVKRLQKDYRRFEAKLYEKSKREICQAAYEILIKQAIVAYFIAHTEEDVSFDTDKFMTTVNASNILDWLYFEYLRENRPSLYPDVAECLRGSITDSINNLVSNASAVNNSADQF